MKAGMEEYDKLGKQVEDGDVMGLYKEAKGLKDNVEGLGSAYDKKKKELLSDISSAKAKYTNARDQAKAMYG